VPEAPVLPARHPVSAVTVKVVAVVSPSPFVTVAVMVGVAPVSVHGGGVHSTSLCAASCAGSLKVPVFADQRMINARACGSSATTRNVMGRPASALNPDWKVLVMRGAG
jgi:hypothetical protein